MYIFPDEIRRAYESMPVPMAYYQYLDGKVVTVLVSDGLCSLLGRDRETLIRMLDNSMFERVHPDDVGRLARIGEDYCLHKCNYDLVYRIKNDTDGQYHSVHTVARRQVMEDGTSLSVLVYTDVTENLKVIHKLEDTYHLYQQGIFYTDPVTQLPNGNYLHEFADETLNRMWLEGQQPALVCLDVTSMKSYNRQYGFAQGDELLRHLDDHNGANRHIMKAMAEAARTMGIQTLAEGVEYQVHLDFLREIGCELAQGFYFSRPTSLEQSLEKIRAALPPLACETREERERRSRSAPTDGEGVRPGAGAQKTTSTIVSIGSLFEHLPGLCFSKEAETGVYLACNQTFAEYAHKQTPAGVVGLTDADIFDAETAKHFVADDQKALSMEEPYIFFEDVPDAAGKLRHFQTTKLKYVNDDGTLCTLGLCQDVTDLVRIIRENGVTREAYERERSIGIVYSHIARTLIQGYMDLYYVNLETEEYTEYHTDDDLSTLSEARRGGGFFETSRREIEQYIHPDDQGAVAHAMERLNLVEALNRNSSFMMTFRLLREDGPIYVSMKVSRMKDDERIIVVGMTNVDEQMKRQKAQERVEEEHLAYQRINALTGDLLSIHIVSPETGHFREYSAMAGFESIALPKEGPDFFAAAQERGRANVHPDDLDRYLSVFTKEEVLSNIRRHGVFSLRFRLMLGDRPNHVQLKAAQMQEKGKNHLIVGLYDIDTQVRQEENYERRLAQARQEACIDALTGVKNKHAYQEAEEQLNHQIREQQNPEFAIAILDVNDLKKVNDTAGHKAGDQFLLDACHIICSIFQHSPVFRVGGDEFAVISQGRDYRHMEELAGQIMKHNRRALAEGGIVIACGMARYQGESCAAEVFERADFHMYENKTALKNTRQWNN